MDDMLRALQSITKQNQATKDKLGQRGLRIELQVHEMLQRVEDLSTRVNSQVTQLETGYKFQEEKLPVSICTMEGEFAKKDGFSRL